MAIKVTAKDAEWKKFLRRCKKAYPAEHCEAIWGEETLDSYRITDFKKLNLTKKNRDTIDYDDAEIKRQKWAAEKEGKVFLGTVHTHTYAVCDGAASTTDHHEAAKDGEKIMGVLVLFKKNERFTTKVEWWFPQRKIAFELLS